MQISLYSALIIHSTRWGHQRRKYQLSIPKNGAFKGSSAAVVFNYWNQLFSLEKEFVQLTPEEWKIQRQERSLPILEANCHGLKQ